MTPEERQAVLEVEPCSTCGGGVGVADGWCRRCGDFDR